MIIQDLFESPQLCPECGGISFSDLILAEKKDACYYKVKASAKVWPSAYASGRLVQCRKKGAANYGKSKNEGVAEGDFDKWGGEIKTPPANYKKNLKQPTSPAKLAKQQAANRQRNQQKVVAEGGILKSIKRGLQGWDKNAVGPSGEKLGNPRDIVNRAKAMDTDTAKKVRAGLDAALDHSPAGLQKRILDRKLKGVAEGSSDNLRANVLDVLLTIYHGAVNDEDMTDTIDSELGEYFAAVEASNDAKLQKVYAFVRDLADANLDIQASGALKAMKKLMGPTYTPPPPSAAPNDTAVRDLAGNFAAAMASHGIKAHPDWKKKDKGVAEGSLNEFAPSGGEGNGPFDYGRAIVEIGHEFVDYYQDEGAQADAKAIIKVGQTFISAGMKSGIQAFYNLDTQIRDHVAEQLMEQGFNVKEDIYLPYKQQMATATANDAAELEKYKSSPEYAARRADDLTISAIPDKPINSWSKPGEPAASVTMDRASKRNIKAEFEKFKQDLALRDSLKNVPLRFEITVGGKPINIANLKEQGMAEDAALAEEFDLIESTVERLAKHNNVDAELIWEDLESLSDNELYVFAVTMPLTEDWQKANKRDRTDGMSRRAVKAYRREHPGSKLKTAVTTKPSKLKRGSKASKRRKSYCSRSRGQMKMHSISCAKTPDKAICKARRRWNCE